MVGVVVVELHRDRCAFISSRVWLDCAERVKKFFRIRVFSIRPSVQSQTTSLELILVVVDSCIDPRNGIDEEVLLAVLESSGSDVFSILRCLINHQAEARHSRNILHFDVELQQLVPHGSSRVLHNLLSRFLFLAESLAAMEESRLDADLNSFVRVDVQLANRLNVDLKVVIDVP